VRAFKQKAKILELGVHHFPRTKGNSKVTARQIILSLTDLFSLYNTLKQSPKMSIAIIGAGITGLSAGYELSKKGHTVTIFEKSAVPGGLGSYIPIANTHIERYYHHFFESDSRIRSYAQQLHVVTKLQFYPSKTSIFVDGKLHPFNTLTDLFSFSPLSITEKLRCALSTGMLKLLPFVPVRLDQISAIDWLHQFAGAQVYKKVWGPLLEGKFSRFAYQVPMLWLWGRVHDRSPKLGYFDGSVKILFDRLIEEINVKNGQILLNTEVKKLTTQDDQIAVTFKKQTKTFDKVILTTVSPVARWLLPNSTPKKYVATLSGIDHLGAVCLILELKKRIQPYYWVNICEKDSPVLVMVEHTNLISPNQYRDKHIVYLANYMHRTDLRFVKTDEQIIDEYTQILYKINPAFKKSWITKAIVSRVPLAQTIFKKPALPNIPSTMSPCKNIYLTNIDQMYPHDRNLNQGIQLAQKVVHLIEQHQSEQL